MNSTQEQVEEPTSEKVYMLSKKVMCKKHPSKAIEYFCTNPSCTERIFCSACLLKKEFCRHDIQTEIKDIGEFLYDQKVLFEMKGLSTSPYIFDFLQNRDKREEKYKYQIMEQYFKFEQQCELLIQQVHSVINELKQNIRQQIEGYSNSYLKCSEKLINSISQNFGDSVLSKFQTFPEVLNTFEVGDSKGLTNLIETLLDDKSKMVLNPTIEKNYKDLISFEQQIPQIDFNRFEETKSYFKVFIDKLSSSSSILLTIKESNEKANDNTENLGQNNNQSAQLTLATLRKIQNSANFSSNHTRTIYTIAKLPNKKFATGSDDGLIKIWDQVTMECDLVLKGHTAGVRFLTLLPNGQMASASYDKSIKLWNIAQSFQKKGPNQNKQDPQAQSNINSNTNQNLNTMNNNLSKTLLGHLSSVLTLKYLGENLLASGSADYTIKIWDMTTGEVQKTLSGHMNDVLCITSTQKLNFIVSGSSDKTIKVWNLAKKFSSACHKTLTGHTDYVWSVFLCHDDNTLLSGGLDKVIKVWNVETGQLLLNLAGHNAQITKVILYSDSIVLSSSLDGSLKFWDVNLKMCVHTLEGHKGAVNSFIVMDDRSLISVGQDKNIMFWD